MEEWKPYPRDRKIKRKENYCVIVPNTYDETNKMPLFCEVCGFAYTSLDEEAHEKFKCCSSCADRWAYSHKDEWLAGWRPPSAEIDKMKESRFLIEETVRFE